ncbi:DUF4440 domain-containing protein [Microbacterium sp. A196]|uniref:DUF4440 domain-containing protein n=1 Tax=Microbacterium sp. A196 TaxID=3457320 RepID=UPI003FD68939
MTAFTVDGAFSGFSVAHGLALTRDEVVASLAAAPPWERYEIEEARIILLSDAAAALVYTGRGYRIGEPPFVALMSSTYVRRGGRWRLAVYQQTPIPAHAPVQSAEHRSVR